MTVQDLFLSTPSARRATADGLPHMVQPHNFYPRPPRGGRLKKTSDDLAIFLFLSTPSARRATEQAILNKEIYAISIHALREEGDAGNISFKVSTR